MLTVIDRQPEHFPGSSRWIETDNLDGKKGYFAFENPVNDTARHIAQGIVTRDAEVFAAFALNAYLRDRGTGRHELNLVEVVGDAIRRLDRSPGDYWWPTATGLLAWVDCDSPSAGLLDWTTSVDEAAKYWTRLASRWSVFRDPNDILAAQMCHR